MQTQTNNMAKVAKTQQKKKKSIISDADRKKAFVAYRQLYSAFLLQNLMVGATLGAASHKAIQLVRAKIATIDKGNPIRKMLLRMNKRHAKRIAKRVMTSKYRDARAVVKPEQRAKLIALISKLVKSANTTLNALAAQYKPKQNILLQIKIKQMNNMRQRAA